MKPTLSEIKAVLMALVDNARKNKLKKWTNLCRFVHKDIYQYGPELDLIAIPYPDYWENPLSYKTNECPTGLKEMIIEVGDCDIGSQSWCFNYCPKEVKDADILKF